VSPGFAGSRSGGILASTWAALVSTGESGYLAAADAIMRTATTIKEGIREIPELEVIGDPLFLIAFKASDDLDIYLVNDALIAQGWRMIALQMPAGLHFCITRPNARPGLAEAYLEALHVAVGYAKDHRGQKAKSGAVYGFAGTSLGAELAKSTMARFLDAMLDLPDDPR
jgi:sphinganine-1-phosphate aldolase